MKTITAKQAIKGQEWAIVSEDEEGLKVYGLYRDEEIARRITRTLNDHYEDAGYELAHIE